MADPKAAALVAAAKNTVSTAKSDRSALLVKLGLCPKCQKRLRKSENPPRGGWTAVPCGNCA